MRLPIPINYNDHIYTEVEIERPKAGTIAETKKIADTGDRYSAVLSFLCGGIASVEDITDKGLIKNVVRRMPFRSAEFLCIKIMLLLDENDGIEGIYECPRCHVNNIAEVKKDGDEVLYDTRDFISGLGISYTDVSFFNIEFQEPVILKNKETNDMISYMSSVEMRHPTLQDCISAYQKIGDSDEMRLQFQIYTEAVTKVDSKIVDNKWKNLYGFLLFESMTNPTDQRILSTKISEFGISRNVRKICKKCGKEWNAKVDTSNFFDYEALV